MRKIKCDEVLNKRDFPGLNDSDFVKQVINYCLDKMNEYEFSISIEKNLEMLSIHPRYIQFWAYTWGNNNDISNTLLKKYNITPVLITGGKNYKFNGFIDRELL